MDFRQTFFDAQGRMSPRNFARGLIVLTGVMVVIQALAVIAGPQANVLQYALVFPYLSVFAKRLHDAGQTAWLWLAFLVGWVMVNALVGGILMQLMVPGAMELSTELVNAMLAPESVDQAALSAKVEEFARLSAVPNILSFLIASGVTGYVAYSLKSDPKPNRFGPPTTGSRSS